MVPWIARNGDNGLFHSIKLVILSYPFCLFLLVWTSSDGLVDTVNVDCHQQEMVVTLSTLVPFHGMVYPRGLTKKSPCMAEFDVQLGDQFIYRVPLRSCNTMNTDTVRHFIALISYNWKDVKWSSLLLCFFSLYRRMDTSSILTRSLSSRTRS